jgi:hypothetical protein
MEALIAPIEWEEIPEVARPRFQAVRSAQGEELGIHYPQEDSPREIGAAIAQWLKSQRE